MTDPGAAVPSLSRALLRVLLVVAGCGAAAWAIYRLWSVILILILSGLFAYVIAPLVDRAARPIRLRGTTRRLPRAAAIAVVYAAIAGALSTGAALVLPRAVDQVGDMLASVPAYAQSVAARERGWSRYYERLRIPQQLRHAIDLSTTAAGEAAVKSGRAALVTVAVGLSNLPWLMLIPILSFFLLKDAADLRRTIVTALPFALRLRGHRLFEDLNATLAAYMRAQLLACALVGGVCGIAFALLGIPYPVLLGLTAGVLEFIPLVGPVTVAAIVGVVAALDSPRLALAALAFLGVLRIVEDYVIYPRLIRRGLELHPLAVIVAVLAGAELGGIAGVFLAVPAVAIGSICCRHWLEWRQSDATSGTTPPPAPPVPFSTG